MLDVWTVVIAVVELLVLEDVLVKAVVNGVLETAEVLEFVNGTEVDGGIVVFPEDGGGVDEVIGVVLLFIGAVLVVAKVAGILQSVPGETPVVGCFGVLGGTVSFCPISNLSQSRPGLCSCSEEKGVPNF